MKTIRAAHLEALLKSGQPVEILDIHPRMEFEKAHTDGAHSLPSAELSPETLLSAPELLSTEPLYFVSQNGALAQMTAYELEGQGLDNIVGLAGGMHGRQNAGLAVVGEEDVSTLVGAP